MNQTSRLFVIGAVSAVAVVALAQTTSNSQSTSRTKQGTGTASGSATASSSSFGSAQGQGQGGRSARGGGSQSGNAGGGQMVIPNYAIVLSKADRTPAISREHWEEEVTYWQNMAARGPVIMAGNWREWDGGLVLLYVQDDQTARNIANNDPGVKRGLFTAQVRAWEVRALNAANGVLPAPGAQTSGGTSTHGGSSSAAPGTIRPGS